MQVILEPDEAWSIMTLVVSQVLDYADLSAEAKAAAKRWRSERAEGTAEMVDLAVAMNEALGTHLDERFTRQIRQKGWYVTSRKKA